MTVSTLRHSIQAESNIPPTSQHLYHNGQLITDDSKTMEDLQINDGEMLALHVRDMRGSTGVPDHSRRGQHQRRRPGTDQDPELIRLQILGDPNLRAEAQRQQPQLAAALEDPQRFAQLFNENFQREQREREERQREIARLNEDPFDIEAQARIEEMIRQERVMENLQNAMEHNPEGRFSLDNIAASSSSRRPRLYSGNQIADRSKCLAEYICYTSL
jgi:DNA damage-inducible protein 1